MYILNDLAKADQGEKLHAAARSQTHARAYTARRSGPARPLAGPRILRLRRARRAAQAY